MVKNEHLDFICRQLNTFTKNCTVCIKQNEYSRPVVIVNMNKNMNVLYMFLGFYDLSKEGNENCDILGNQISSVLPSY